MGFEAWQGEFNHISNANTLSLQLKQGFSDMLTTLGKELHIFLLFDVSKLNEIMTAYYSKRYIK